MPNKSKGYNDMLGTLLPFCRKSEYKIASQGPISDLWMACQIVFATQLLRGFSYPQGKVLEKYMNGFATKYANFIKKFLRLGYCNIKIKRSSNSKCRKNCDIIRIFNSFFF